MFFQFRCRLFSHGTSAMSSARPVVIGSFLLVLGSACGAEGSLADAQLSDGSSLRASLAQADTVIALFYDPADCMVCESPFSGWIDWSNRGVGRRVVITLTRPPTGNERDLLVISRLDKTPWLMSASILRLHPAAYSFIGDVQVDSAHGKRQIAALYGRWLKATDSVASVGMARHREPPSIQPR
jgi:hypothetical protein